VLAEEMDGSKAFVERNKQKEEGMEIVVDFKNAMGDGVRRQGPTSSWPGRGYI
jgi:hypothetical protein